MARVNDSLYGIPFHARRVVKFNPLDKSITEIGPDLFGNNVCKPSGVEMPWLMAVSYTVNCPPFGNRRGILKIDRNTDTDTDTDTNTCNVTELDINLLYVQSLSMDAFTSCRFLIQTVAIMKLDPNNNDTMSSVGDDLGDTVATRYKYTTTVVGIEGCVYGIHYVYLGIANISSNTIQSMPSNESKSKIYPLVKVHHREENLLFLS